MKKKLVELNDTSKRIQFDLKPEEKYAIDTVTIQPENKKLNNYKSFIEIYV